MAQNIGNMFPNRFNSPKTSSAMPNIGQPTNTRNTPNAKQAVALNFSGLKKYPMVRLGPMVMGTPAMNMRLPSLMSALLKNRLTPSTVKIAPRPSKADPSRRSPFLIFDCRFAKGLLGGLWFHQRQFECQKPTVLAPFHFQILPNHSFLYRRSHHIDPSFCCF